MSRSIPKSVTALVVTTIALDADAGARSITQRCSTKLLGVGLVTHSIDIEGNLKFRVRSRAATLMTGEADLLDWVEDELTLPSFITGYDIVTSVQTLIDKASPAQHLSIAELSNIDWPAAELSLDPTPVHWTPLSDVCAAAGIRVITENVARDQRDWLIGRSAEIEERSLLKAAAIWKLWAVRATQRGFENDRLAAASTRLDAWLDDYLANRTLPVAEL